MRTVIAVSVFSILISMAIKPAMDEFTAAIRSSADAETMRYVQEELPGIIRNDVSIYFPDRMDDAAISAVQMQ